MSATPSSRSRGGGFDKRLTVVAPWCSTHRSRGVRRDMKTSTFPSGSVTRRSRVLAMVLLRNLGDCSPQRAIQRRQPGGRRRATGGQPILCLEHRALRVQHLQEIGRAEVEPQPCQRRGALARPRGGFEIVETSASLVVGDDGGRDLLGRLLLSLAV